MLEKDKVIENVQTRQEKKKIVSQDFFYNLPPVGLEPPAGDVSSIADCQEWGKEVRSLVGGDFFWSRSSTSEECQILPTILLFRFSPLVQTTSTSLA